jgi:hypothetical protein
LLKNEFIAPLFPICVIYLPFILDGILIIVSFAVYPIIIYPVESTIQGDLYVVVGVIVVCAIVVGALVVVVGAIVVVVGAIVVVVGAIVVVSGDVVAFLIISASDGLTYT